MTALTWRSASATSQGNVRSHNEDAVLELPAVGVWVIADGMGGHDAGDVASRMIVESLCALPRAERLSELLDRVEDRLRSVNQRLFGVSLERGATTGSTVAVLVAFDAHCVSIWAGDSRIYRLREGVLTRVTRDHTEVQDLLDGGILDEKAAAEHSASNVITRAVGGAQELFLDVELRELRQGDRYLLCSDGVYKELSDTDLARLVATEDASGACRALMSQALAGQCSDNVSVVVVEFS
jgi:serine/threonine protein phosphatase PrpC